MNPTFFVTFFTSELMQQLNNPGAVSTGNPFQVTSLMTLFTNILGWSIFFGALIVFFCLLFSGVQWMTAGGDTGSVQTAKSRLTTCLIGFAILACSYAIFLLVQYFFGLQIGQTPGSTPPPLPPGQACNDSCVAQGQSMGQCTTSCAVGWTSNSSVSCGGTDTCCCTTITAPTVTPTPTPTPCTPQPAGLYPYDPGSYYSCGELCALGKCLTCVDVGTDGSNDLYQYADNSTFPAQCVTGAFSCSTVLGVIPVNCSGPGHTLLPHTYCNCQ